MAHARYFGIFVWRDACCRCPRRAAAVLGRRRARLGDAVCVPSRGMRCAVSDFTAGIRLARTGLQCQDPRKGCARPHRPHSHTADTSWRTPRGRHPWSLRAGRRTACARPAPPPRAHCPVRRRPRSPGWAALPHRRARRLPTPDSAGAAACCPRSGGGCRTPSRGAPASRRRRLRPLGVLGRRRVGASLEGPPKGRTRVEGLRGDLLLRLPPHRPHPWVTRVVI